MEQIELIKNLQDIVEKQTDITKMLIKLTQTLIEEEEKDSKETDLEQIERLTAFAEGSQYLSKTFMNFTGELITGECKS